MAEKKNIPDCASGSCQAHSGMVAIYQGLETRVEGVEAQAGQISSLSSRVNLLILFLGIIFLTVTSGVIYTFTSISSYKEVDQESTNRMKIEITEKLSSLEKNLTERNNNLLLGNREALNEIDKSFRERLTSIETRLSIIESNSKRK